MVMAVFNYFRRQAAGFLPGICKAAYSVDGGAGGLSGVPATSQDLNNLTASLAHIPGSGSLYKVH